MIQDGDSSAFIFQVDTLDDTNMKKLLLQFEKRVYKNQEMRIKFPDMPEKYKNIYNTCHYILFKKSYTLEVWNA